MEHELDDNSGHEEFGVNERKDWTEAEASALEPAGVYSQWLAVLDNDRRTFEQLHKRFRRYAQKHASLLPGEAYMAVDEFLLSLLELPQGYLQNAPSPDGRIWLMLRHAAISFRRKLATVQKYTDSVDDIDDVDTTGVPPFPSPEHGARLDQAVDNYLQAVDAMRKKFPKPVLAYQLRVSTSMSDQEIDEVLGEGQGTARKYVSQCWRWLRQNYPELSDAIRA